MANVVSNDMYNQLVQLYWGDTAKADKYKTKIETSYSTDDYNKLTTNLNKLYWSSSTTPVSSTSSSTPTTSTSSSTRTNNTSSKDYNWINQNWNNYRDSGWYYSATERNAATGWAEFGINQTSTPTQTDTTSTTPTSNNAKILRDAWDKKSYQEQQDLLNKNPWLKEQVQKAGWTFKTADETPTKTDTGTWTPSGQWDYQDNSPERMQQIADNLEKMYQTNPWLFANEQTFRDFFINWVNRTPEQEKFLMDYYKNRQIYNEYDWYTSEAVWGMYAYWKVPESYLNYVKNSNPQRYAEIMDAKDREQDKIKNNSSYDSILEQNWFESTNNLEWQKKEWLFVDEDGDLIDDRMQHKATEEERQKVDRINEIDARMLEINNALKWAEEDLTKAYPWATKATIMALVNDRSQNLLREKDDLMVERTQLAWTVEYLQSERQNEDKAGQQTIANLQKNLWMYYDYSPEWMSELAQAQYAATNVTLDQADNWTDTQKQMALDSVLSDYFDKYGSIIQRSKSQVINDVMNYAKKNGVSLSQALEDNFLSQLRSKPQFEQINNAMSAPDVVRIWTDANGNPIYWTYNSATWQYEPIYISGTLWWAYNYGGGNLTWGTATTPGWVNYNTVSEEGKVGWLWNFLSGVSVWDYGGWCWAFVNDYLESIWVWRIYDNDLSTKLNSRNSDTPAVWDIAVFDYSNAPESANISADARKYWHVAIVVWVDEDKWVLTIVESNKDWSKTVWEPREVPISNLYLKWYFDPSKWYNWVSKPATDQFGGKFANDQDWNQNWYFDSLVPYFKTIVQDWKIDLTDTKYKDVLKDYNITSKEFNEMAKNYANTELKSGWGQQAANALEIAVKLYDYLWNDSSLPGRAIWQAAWWTDNAKAKWEYNSLMKRLSLKELFAAKELWATFGAMSDSEWNLLENAATDLDWYKSNFSENLEYLIESLYDAAVDWKSNLPRNFAGSKAEQMIKTRKAEWSWLWNSKFNPQWWVNDIYSDLFD